MVEKPISGTFRIQSTIIQHLYSRDMKQTPSSTGSAQDKNTPMLAHTHTRTGTHTHTEFQEGTDMWEGHVDEVESTLQTTRNHSSTTARWTHCSQQEHVLVKQTSD